MTARGLALGLLALLALPASAGAAGCVALSDFSQDAPGAFPKGWRVPRDDGYTVYRVLQEEGVTFIRGLSRGIGTQAAIERPWDLQEQPVLSWRWRPRVFPERSDERQGATNDSALGVYVGFPRSFVAVKSVKYIWSRIVPVGTTASASGGFTRMLVLRTGPAEPGRWYEERVDVRADYRRLFGDEPGKPRGIGLLTDADDTRSVAEGDYADFRVCPP